MKDGLLQINEFSNLTKLTRKALYVYEQKNILIPVFIDPNNNYRYYHNNQLLLAKRIMLLKQAGLTLTEIGQVITSKLSDAEVNDLINMKLQVQADKINRANQAIEQLNTLKNAITEQDGAVKFGHLEALDVMEYEILPNDNICVALNHIEKVVHKNNSAQNKKIIKYERNGDHIYPIAVAVQVKKITSSLFLPKPYFDFDAYRSFYKVNPYEEESILKIKQIIKNGKIKFYGSHIYELILNSDDYLYSTKRFSEFIFPV